MAEYDTEDVTNHLTHQSPGVSSSLSSQEPGDENIQFMFSHQTLWSVHTHGDH